MKCWRCGNELTTGDAPNSAQCRRCEQASISSSPASAGSALTDIDMLNWIEDNPRENLEAIDFKIRNGQSRTVRDAIRFHIERGL